MISLSDEQVKRVIETLDAELPTLFETDISYDIYSPDIVFKDPVNRFRGKFSYRVIFWTLRFHGKLFFTDLHFDLHQVEPADAETVLATWTVRGRLRLPWHTQLYFNGTSTYSLTETGLVWQHVDQWDRSPAEILKQFLPTPTRPQNLD
ncbi:MAG: DUF2358 domain-containing protein [Cyanobacteria bacterium P01_A01_bin.123]